MFLIILKALKGINGPTSADKIESSKLSYFAEYSHAVKLRISSLFEVG